MLTVYFITNIEYPISTWRTKLSRCDRQRRNLESPLSEISAKTSTTIETERARRGDSHHSPRLATVRGEQLNQDKEQLEIKILQNFFFFLKKFLLCVAS